MSVDRLRETFHINHISPKEIDTRLVAQSYRSDIVRAIQEIKDWGSWETLARICRVPIMQGRTPVYAETGKPCIKTRNVIGLIVSKEDLDCVEKKCAEELKRFSVQNEDLLMNRSGAGSIGRVAIYFGYDEPLTNEELFRISINHPNDSAYICCFLSSWWGERAIEQGINGSTGQLKLVQDHVSSLPIVLPNSLVQKYIGDKVRQAERLRERSRELEKQIKTLEYKIILADEPDVFKGKSWRTGAKVIDDNRLDSHYYRPDYLESYKQTLNNNFINLGDLCIQIRYGTSVAADYVPSGNGILFIRGLDLTRNSLQLAESVDLDNKHLETVGKNKLKAGEVLITRSGTVRIAASVPLQAEGAAFGSFMMAMTLNEEWEPEFIAWFLNSWIGQSQVKKLQNGAIQQNINISELSSIRIWKASQASQQEIKKLILTWQQLQEYAQNLTTATKLLVEALIEGNVTELDLQEAQEAIQQGDITLDRQILSRLTRKGIPCGGEKTNEPPLFPDLDALYRVLSDDSDANNSPDWNSAPKSRQRWRSPTQLSRRAAEASTSYWADDSAVTLLDEEG